MGYWKTLTTTNLRVYFPVKVGGNLVPGLDSILFTSVLINPNDDDSDTSIVLESTQKPGIYYTDLDSNFLVGNGIGMYGLSIGIHKPAPNRIDDEVLFPIDVTSGDLSTLISLTSETNEKTDELWRVHGLDITKPMTVNKSGREVSGITQTFVELPNNTVKVTRT